MIREEKWHQSSSFIGHISSWGHGAIVWAPNDNNNSRAFLIRKKPIGVPGSMMINISPVLSHSFLINFCWLTSGSSPIEYDAITILGIGKTISTIFQQ